MRCADCGIKLNRETAWTGHDGAVRRRECDALRYVDAWGGLYTDREKGDGSCA